MCLQMAIQEPLPTQELSCAADDVLSKLGCTDPVVRDLFSLAAT
jgi:hypothetical protein